MCFLHGGPFTILKKKSCFFKLPRFSLIVMLVCTVQQRFYNLMHAYILEHQRNLLHF